MFSRLACRYSGIYHQVVSNSKTLGGIIKKYCKDEPDTRGVVSKRLDLGNGVVAQLNIEDDYFFKRLLSLSSYASANVLFILFSEVTKTFDSFYSAFPEIFANFAY